MSPPNKTRETALHWLIRIDGGPLDPAEQTAFDRWLNESVRHQAEFLRLRRAWDNGNRLRQLRPVDGTIDEDLLASGPFWQAFFRGETAFSLRVVLTSVACLVMVTWVVLLMPGWVDYSTGVGDSQNVVLADGSRLVLNTHTRVRVSLRKQQRLLQIEHGEAFFKVAHDARRPFDVRAGSTTLRAVGTAFSVRREPDGDIGVIVAEGSVAIDPVAKAGAREGTLESANSLLEVGDVASIRAEGLAISRLSRKQLDHRLAWTMGILWFDDVPLLEVAAEFNRYNRRQMLVADPAIAGLKIGGSFQATDVDSFISALESLHVKAIVEQRPGNGEVVRLVGAAISQSM